VPLNLNNGDDETDGNDHGKDSSTLLMELDEFVFNNRPSVREVSKRRSSKAGNSKRAVETEGIILYEAGRRDAKENRFAPGPRSRAHAALPVVQVGIPQELLDSDSGRTAAPPASQFPVVDGAAPRQTAASPLPVVTSHRAKLRKESSTIKDRPLSEGGDSKLSRAITHAQSNAKQGKHNNTEENPTLQKYSGVSRPRTHTAPDGNTRKTEYNAAKLESERWTQTREILGRKVHQSGMVGTQVVHKSVESLRVRAKPQEGLDAQIAQMTAECSELATQMSASLNHTYKQRLSPIQSKASLTDSLKSLDEVISGIKKANSAPNSAPGIRALSISPHSVAQLHSASPKGSPKAAHSNSSPSHSMQFLQIHNSPPTKQLSTVYSPEPPAFSSKDTFPHPPPSLHASRGLAADSTGHVPLSPAQPRPAHSIGGIMSSERTLRSTVADRAALDVLHSNRRPSAVGASTIPVAPATKGSMKNADHTGGGMTVHSSSPSAAYSRHPDNVPLHKHHRQSIKKGGTVTTPTRDIGRRAQHEYVMYTALQTQISA